MRLYDLTEQYMTLAELIEEDASNEQLQAMLDGIEGKIDEKIENTVKVMKSIEGNISAIDAEIARLKHRRDAMENKVKFLKSNIEENMKRLDVEKIKGTFFNISLQKNPPKVVVLDDFMIPQTFYFTPEPQKQLKKADILDYWKSGHSIPGVEIVQEKSLRVR